MPGQATLPDENTAAAFQVDPDQAAVSQHAALWRSTRVGTGLAFAVLMLIGFSAFSLHPAASAAPSHLVPAVAFNGHLSQPRHTGPILQLGKLGPVSYTGGQWQPATFVDNPGSEVDVIDLNKVDLGASTSIAQGSARHPRVRMDPWQGFLDDSQLTDSDWLYADMKTKVLKDLGIDPKDWWEFQDGNQDRSDVPAKLNSTARRAWFAAKNKDWEARRKEWLARDLEPEFNRRMGIEMAAVLRSDLPKNLPSKKRMCIFDFDGTLTEDKAGALSSEKFGSEQRIADLRDFLETLHMNAYLVVCSRNDRDVIVKRLRAVNLLHLFDIVQDANHMLHLGLNKGRALNELLLPLFPSVDGPADVMFVDDDYKNIRDLEELAPDCTTFQCQRHTGVTSADMRFLRDVFFYESEHALASV